MSNRKKPVTHSFSPKLAEVYSIQKALIIKEILGWCEYNMSKGQNYHEGKYWTRRTAKEYHKKFPYMNEKSIDRWLRELVDDGILYANKFNKKKFDKTNWHCVNLKKYYSIVRNTKNDDSETTKTEKSKKFQRPAREEVAKFAREYATANYDLPIGWEKGLQRIIDDYFDHYDSKAWTIGGESMKEWKPSIKKFVRNGYHEGKFNSPKNRADDKESNSEGEAKFGNTRLSEVERAIYELDQEDNEGAGVYYSGN